MRTGNADRQILDRCRRFIEAHRLLAPSDRVLVACSGGADSLALLDILGRLSQPLGITVVGCYVDHGQHPRATSAARRVERHCRRLSVPFVLCRADAARAAPGSNEDALRRERARLLEETAEDLGCRRIATGHTRDDQAETVLLRIVRGTGVAGLRGIPVRRGRFIRPLLWSSKETLERYCRSRRLAFDRDPANRDMRFVRNRIRHHVLPRLKTLNPAVAEALLRLSRAAARDQRALAALAREVPMEEGKGFARILWNEAARLPAAVLTRLWVLMLRKVKGPGASLPLGHGEVLLRHMRRAGPGCWSHSLPGGVVARRDKRWLSFELPGEKTSAFRLKVECPGEVRLPQGRMRFSLQRFRPERAGPCRVFFDPELAPFPLTVRSLRPGDRLEKWGGGSREVCRILMDAKVPRADRKLVPLLVCKKRILWIAGVRRSRHAGMAAAGRLALCVEYFPAGSDLRRGSSAPGG